MWALPLVIKLVFLLYTTVNLRAFEAFRCYDFGAADGRWLMADVQVACESAEHYAIQLWAWVAIVVYPIGWTITTFMLLITARKAILGEQRPTGLRHALRFVFDEYEPSYFWWEVLEMLRRFLLVGLMSILPTTNHVGSVLQLSIATLFSIFFLMLQLQVRPSYVLRGYLLLVPSDVS